MFINTKKVYQLELSKKAHAFIMEAEQNSEDLSTLIFLDNLEKGSETETLLLKILEAVKLTEANYIFIDKSVFPTILLSHFKKSKFTSIENLLIFGLPADQVGLNTISLKYIEMNSGNYKILFSDDLKALKGNAGLKGKLWNSLKKIFKV